jgi:uncharacterized protein
MNQLTRLSFSALPVAIIVASGVIVLALFGVAAAGQLQDGRTAFQHGDYATAMRLLRPLADQGNAVAQSYLGDMYPSGEGVPQNYAQAVHWYRRAAAGGVLTGVAAAGQLQDGVVAYQNGDYATAMRLL